MVSLDFGAGGLDVSRSHRGRGLDELADPMHGTVKSEQAAIRVFSTRISNGQLQRHRSGTS